MLTSDVDFRATLGFSGVNAPTGAAVVFAFIHTGTKTPAECAADIANVWAVSDMDGMQPADIALTSVLVKQGPDETGPQASFPATVIGSAGAVSSPPNVCYLVHKNTAEGGRRGRGRMFIPGVPEGTVDDNGQLVAGQAAQLQSRIDAFMAGLLTEELIMALEHGPSYTWTINENGQPRRVPVAGPVPTLTALTSLTADPKVATQRRRLRR